MLWIALAVMTGLAMGFMLWPLAFRGRERPAESREADFYRAQLDEIGRDVERGQLPPEEAASARTEAARRLLAASDKLTQARPAGALWRRRAAAVVVFVVLPVVALGVYVRVGQPDLPDEPLSARRMDLNAPGAIEAAVAKIEAHLMKAPGDVRGWAVLAPVYMRLGRFADAAGAYRQAIRLGDDSPQARAALGEALVAMSDGVVTADARAEFDKAGDVPKAKFYLALAAEQDGKKDEAKKAYEALAPLAKGEAPWMLGLRAHLAGLNGAAAPAAAAAPQTASAPAFSPDQLKMIEGMVQGLAGRLAKQGGSAEEWVRLIRAYSVLHQPERAKDALASARKALGPNAEIDALARELRL
jgi:cytochrome c-type biogenesis protein CcmH